MRRVALTSACAALLAGCDLEVQMSLIAAPEARDSDADMSCVTSVSVLAYGNNLNEQPVLACRALPAPGIDRLSDLPISQSVSLGIPPSGLNYMIVRGMNGRPGACDGWSVFTADAFYDGGDSITLPAYPNLDCGRRDTLTWTVRAVDFLNLLDTRQCAPPPNAAALNLTVGTYRSAITGGWYDYAGTETPVAADGTAAVAGMFANGLFGSCIAADIYNFPVTETLTCIYPDTPSPCTGAGNEVIVPFAAVEDLEASYDGALFQQWGAVVVGVVIDSARAPISNATITMLDPERGQLVLTSYGARVLSARGGNATDTSGTFMLYSSQPVEIEVTAPGRGSKRFWIGGWFDGISSPAVLVM